MLLLYDSGDVLIKNIECNIMAVTDCLSNTGRGGVRAGEKTAWHSDIPSLKANALIGTH